MIALNLATAASCLITADYATVYLVMASVVGMLSMLVWSPERRQRSISGILSVFFALAFVRPTRFFELDKSAIILMIVLLMVLELVLQRDRNAEPLEKTTAQLSKATSISALVVAVCVCILRIR